MNKKIENIYNNNLNFTNNLILKRRKQNQILAVISIALFLFSAYLFANSFGNISKPPELELNKLQNSNKSFIEDRTSFNHTKTTVKYFSFSLINLEDNRPKNINNFHQISFNFLILAKKSFLTEMCFDKDALISTDNFKNLNSVNKVSLAPYLEEDLFSQIQLNLNSKIICFSDSSGKIAVEIQNNIHSITPNDDKKKTDTLNNNKNLFPKSYGRELNATNLMVRLDNQTNLRVEQKNLGFNYKENKLEHLLFFSCEQNLLSFDLEKYFNFYFYKKAHIKSLDKELLNLDLNKRVKENNKSVNFCLNVENKFGVISSTVPQCLEFVNIEQQNIVKENLINEIDIFIYDIKSKTLNLYFLNKLIISKETIMKNSLSGDILSIFSIFYNEEINSINQKGNLRICDFVKDPGLLDKKIKMRGIYLEWNIIHHDSQDVKLSSMTCFEKFLSIYK